MVACRASAVAGTIATNDTEPPTDVIELALASGQLRPDVRESQTQRLLQLIHRAIPYPVLLVAQTPDGVILSLAHKRASLGEAGKMDPTLNTTPNPAMNASLNRQTLGDLLRRASQRDPNKLAIRCGNTDWAYRQFDDICNRFAAGLASLGVEVGDRVAVLARNSHGFAALRFAVARRVRCWCRSTSC